MTMECAEVRELLHPYADNELTGEERGAVAAHLRDCSGCAQALADIEALHHQMRRARTYALPAGLESRVRSLISASRSRSAQQPWRGMGALAASHIAAAVLGGVIGLLLMARIGGGERVVDDVVAAHVRSLITGQPTQIASTDQHVIRPWFGGKVTYAPLVKDLGAEGFPLLGARVDYVPPRAVAAIVYTRRMHRITLFVLPNERQGPLATTTARQGYNIVGWRDGNFSYYAVSDLSRPELETFAKLMRSASTP
jgi:anti-sigma factor RsiW